MKSTALVIILVLLTACSSKAQPTVTEQQTNRFYSDELIGYWYKIMSETSLEEYLFYENGNALKNFGRVGGMSSSRIPAWQIDSEGRLVFKYLDYKVFWTKLSSHGDLIEVENYILRSCKPHRHDYIVQQGKMNDAAPNYPTDKFSTEELAGNSLLFFADRPDYKYTFNPDGTGTLFSDEPDLQGYEKDELTFRWLVNKEGRLYMTKASGRVMIWSKLSRKNDVITAEWTRSPSPPSRRTFRRSKE